MEITNKHNLPDSLYQALANDSYVPVGDISVTGLIKPPQMRQLEIRHDAELVQDAADRMFMFFGTIGHSVLEGIKTDAQQELRLSTYLRKWQVSGTLDLLEKTGILSDYKTTSTYSVAEVKPEWEQQLNLYALLADIADIEVSKLQIVAILRDWTKGKARNDRGYPQAPVKVLSVNKWHPSEAMEFAAKRVKLHQEEESLASDKLTPCTSKERWERPTKYAVMKKGNKKATKLFDNQRAASLMIVGKANMYVETRLGESIRCESYCVVQGFCHQYKQMKGAQ